MNDKNIKCRNVALDATKGLLIVLLILHHIVDVGVRICDIHNPVLDAMRMLQRPIAVCYFMQAFFLISGLCSSFTGKFIDFFARQFKTLLLPAIFFDVCYAIYFGGVSNLPRCLVNWLTRGGSFWFVVSLFTAKVLFF